MSLLLAISIGGCPANVDPNNAADPAGGLLQVFGQSPNGAGGNSVSGASTGNSQLIASNLEYAVRKGSSVNLVLHNPPENPSGVTFSVLDPPDVGTIGDIEQIGENRAQVLYTPPFTFSGIIRFRYAIHHGDASSDLADVVIAIYPEMRFAVVDDDNDGVIRATAFTQSGEPLPQANFIWHVDNMEIETDLVANEMVELDPGNAGAHNIGLFAKYPETSIRMPASALDGRATLRAQTAPRVFGTVQTQSAEPISNIRVSAVGNGSISTYTDANGRFALALAAGWSGEIRVTVDQGNVQQPPRYAIYDLRQNIDELEFIVKPANTPQALPIDPDTNRPIVPAAGDRTFSLVEDVARVLRLVNNEETNSAEVEIEIVSLPARGVLRDPSSGSAIFAQQLPYVLAEQGESVEYIPAPNYAGSDSFEFRYRMQETPGAPGVARVNVAAANDAPSFVDGSRRDLVTSRDIAKSVTLVAVDADANGEELDWNVANAPQHGSIAIRFNPTESGEKNRITYQPQAGFVGTDQFSIRCTDRFGLSAVVDFDVNVTALVVLAQAGGDRDAVGFQEVVLSGSESVAPQGASFAWRQIAGPSVAITGANQESMRFRVPPILEPTEFEFELTVASGSLTSTDRVKVNAEYRRQSLVYAVHAGLERHWETRVEYNVNGTMRSGFASFAAVDNGVGFWGDESGTACSSPLWNFQGRDGLGGILFSYVNAYQATGNKLLLRRAQRLGDSLLVTQEALDGGWYQDSAYANGQWYNVGVWGPFGDNFNFPDDSQGFFTLDDATSQSCALALLRLYEAGGGVRFLNGAKRFGDHLVNLKTIQYQGQFPYANGGIPQVLPLDRALVVAHNQNMDPRNPDGPYMPHKTLNDETTADAIIFLQELYRVTNDARYAEAVRLNVDYLLERHAAYGYRGWAQQYHFLTDAIAWGRKKEPPAFVTCENSIVDTLLLWRQREDNAGRIDSIENAIQLYIEWLRDDLERPEGYPQQVWRYYNHDPVVAPMNEVVFADDFQRFFGAENEANAGSGQPNRGSWDQKWIGRLNADQPNGVADFSRAANYLTLTAENPVGVIAVNWQNAYTRQDVEGGWSRNFTVNGQARIGLTTAETAQNSYGMVRRINILTDEIIDADADGFNNDVEIGAGSDPYDSESVPAQ